MNLLRNLLIAVLMTMVTTVVYGIAYPLLVTGVAQAVFTDKANGQLVTRNSQTIGSAIIAQPFTSPGYFHPRPSGAGAGGYDATASGGTNLGPTSKKLIDAVAARVADAHAENPSAPVPVDLVTSSGSGLDPDLSPAAALFQVPRVAKTRGLTEDVVRQLVLDRITPRQLGILGEPTVNVLLLNLALDDRFPAKTP
jgi:K+-transporting ATPase ATPase C chain